MQDLAPVATLIVAAGGGSRLGGDRKQLRRLAGKTLVAHGICALREALGRFPCCVALPAGLLPADAGFEAKEDIHACTGGETRTASVLAGLYELSKHWPGDGWVAVHDAARPCAGAADIAELARRVQAQGWDGGALAIPVDDSLHLGGKRGNGQAQALRPVPREGLWAAQTPQIFRVAPLQAALQAQGDGADEMAAMLAAGARALLVQGRRTNFKVTWPEDLPLARAVLEDASRP